MSERKHTDKDYLFLSAMLRARVNKFINEDTVEFGGENLLACWSDYLLKEKEMVNNA